MDRSLLMLEYVSHTKLHKHTKFVCDESEWLDYRKRCVILCLKIDETGLMVKNINLEIFGYENSSFFLHKRQMFIFAQLEFFSLEKCLG